MRIQTLFFCLLLLSVFVVVIAQEQTPCHHCGVLATPGQHGDCIVIQNLQNQATEAQQTATEAMEIATQAINKLNQYIAEQEKEDEFDDAMDALEIVALPVTAVIGLGKTVKNGVDNSQGYICSQCKTLQYGSHICVPEECMSCGTIGTHECAGPAIQLDTPPSSEQYHFSCMLCGSSSTFVDYESYMNYSHVCITYPDGTSSTIR